MLTHDERVAERCTIARIRMEKIKKKKCDFRMRQVYARAYLIGE